mgnify:CR=1 FL=1|tara:strand:+ start:460 stop:1665 length:1206 start_codon:yes stop_codon:yes gene_type:complete
MKNNKVITVNIWHTESKSFKPVFPFFNPFNALSHYGGLHASMLLFERKEGSNKAFPFHNKMQPQALPKKAVTSEYKDKSFSSGNRERQEYNNEDAETVDAYINFIPKQEKAGDCPEALPTLSKTRKSSYDETKNEFVFEDDLDPYDEAISEYYVYRNGREERLPFSIEIPVKTDSQEGLDYDKIKAWWSIINRSHHLKYSYFSKNCSYGVLQALKAGGAEKFLKYDDFLISTPKKTQFYAESLLKTINVKEIIAEKYSLNNTIEYIMQLIKKIFSFNASKKEKKEYNETPLEIKNDLTLMNFQKTLLHHKDEVKGSKELSLASKILTSKAITKESLSYDELIQIEELISDYIFYNPNSVIFNEITSFMITVDKQKAKKEFVESPKYNFEQSREFKLSVQLS